MTLRPLLLSIQSEVVYGHVGNGAARFALQRLGFEVLALPTVLFSNHPGHGRLKGRAIAGGELRGLLDGLDGLGILRHCGAVLSGYLGAPAQAALVRDAVMRVRKANPKAIFACDPVFGDEGGVYARPGVDKAMARDLVPIADIATPNRFELAALAHMRVTDEASAVVAAHRLARPLVVATSIPVGKKTLATMAITPRAAWTCRVARRAHAPHGTGDLLSALFLAHRLKGAAIPVALEKAASGVDALIRAAARHKTNEMPLIAAQDALTRTTATLKAIEL